VSALSDLHLKMFLEECRIEIALPLEYFGLSPSGGAGGAGGEFLARCGRAAPPGQRPPGDESRVNFHVTRVPATPEGLAVFWSAGVLPINPHASDAGSLQVQCVRDALARWDACGHHATCGELCAQPRSQGITPALPPPPGRRRWARVLPR